MLMVLKNGWIDFVLILVVTLVSQIKFILIFCETEQEYILETDVPNVTEQNVVIKKMETGLNICILHKIFLCSGTFLYPLLLFIRRC